MNCKCGSDLIINVSGKTSDMCCTSFGSVESDGYVPHNIGIGGGDYLEFSYCGGCGQIQNFQPLTTDAVVYALKKS